MQRLAVLPKIRLTLARYPASPSKVGSLQAWGPLDDQDRQSPLCHFGASGVSGIAYWAGALVNMSASKLFPQPPVCIIRAMTPEERDRMNWLCMRIAEEKDPETFDALVKELNDLLEVKHQRIHPEHHRKSN